MADGTNYKLRATTRTAFGGQVKRLRAEGLVPASVYRHGGASIHISLPESEFQKVYRRAGQSQRIELCVEGSPPMQVVIHKVDRDPIAGTPQHVALLELLLSDKITLDMPIRFIGEAPIVKSHGASILTARDHLRIVALPGDLPTHIDVDISVLIMQHLTIRVSDVVLPPNVVVLDNPDEVVANAVLKAKRADAEEAPAEVEEAVAA